MDDNTPVATIYDLVEYKISKELDTFTIGTKQWDIMFRVLGLYLEGKINVTWAGNDIRITMVDGSDPNPLIFDEEDNLI